MDKIDGKKLRMLIVNSGLTQTEVSEKSGVDKFTLNRWCNSGPRKAHRNILETLAKGFGIDVGELLRQIGPDEEKAEGSLTPAEAAMVNAFRGLNPIEQAKVLIAFDESVNQLKSSHGLQLK